MTSASDDIIFRPLAANEEGGGYRVIVETVAWLRRKKIDLWDEPLPRAIYTGRHSRGENCALFLDGVLAAVVSLEHGVPARWSTTVSHPEAIWFGTLATAEGFHGRGIGRVMVERAMAYLGEAGHTHVYLDCAPGFLETFYESLGFEPVVRAQVRCPHSGRMFDAVLFRKRLS